MEKIFKQYYSALCLFANKIIGDELLAEDIVQEVFIRFEEERACKDMEEYYRAWLYTAVKNASLNALREKKKTRENDLSYVRHLQTGNDEPERDAEHWMIRAETGRQLWCEVQKLPTRMQQVIRMHYLENRSVRDIAETLHLHISTVKTQKQRGLALLRKYLTLIMTILFFSIP